MRIREIIESSFDGVTELLMAQARDVLGWEQADEWPDTPSLQEIQRWRVALQDSAAEQAGLSFITYLRLRISAVLDDYTRQIIGILGMTPDSDEAALVRTVLRRRAADIGLLTTTRDARATQRQFLQNSDLSVHERSLRFLVAAFNWWYRDQGEQHAPPREDLDPLKQHVYGHIVDLRRVTAAVRDDQELADALQEAFAPAAMKPVLASRDEQRIAEFVTDRSEPLTRAQRQVNKYVADAVAALESGLYETLAEKVGAWSPRARRDLLVRYLGFPFWDILVYPVQTLSDVGERDHVEVSRISPLDAVLLTSDQTPRPALSGVALHHFGAFFDAAGRERDYLWGRLDAAERLITLLFDDQYHPGLQAPDPHHCAMAFRAIVTEERSDGLRNVDALKDVEQRIGRLSRPVQPTDPLVTAE